MFLALLASGAFGHSPHDVALAATRGASGEILGGENSNLALFDAEGLVLAHLPSPGKDPACIAALGPSAWLLVTGEGAAWRSEDDARTWQPLQAGDVNGCSVATGGALVGGEEGVWWVPSSPGADAERLSEATVAVVQVGESAEGEVLALDEEGALWRIEEGMLNLGHPGPWSALAAGPEATLLGGETQVATWDSRGAIPTSEGPEGTLVLAAGSDAWLAAGAERGVWASRDEGQSWTLEEEGLEELAEGSGAPPDGVHWFFLEGGEEGWLAATWEGLYVRAPDDERWIQIELRTTPFVRSLAWMDDGTLLTAPYGSGLSRGTPGEDDWVDAAVSLDFPWLRTVLARGGTWWGVSGRHLYRSDDEGDHWEVLSTGLALDGDIVAVTTGWPEDPRVWAGGQDETGAGILTRSEDGGESWTAMTLGSCQEKPNALALGDTVSIEDGAVGDTAGVEDTTVEDTEAVEEAVGWVACEGELFRFEGEDLQRIPLPEDGAVVVLFVEEDGVVLGGDMGLWRREGERWRLLREGNVRTANRYGDGWMVAADEGLVVLGEEGERALGWPVDDLVSSLSIATDGRLAAGTFSGAWTSEDEGDTWTLASDWNRYDDLDRTWWYDEKWVGRREESAKALAMMAGTSGAVAEWRLSATALLLWARGNGELDICLDGGAEERVVVDGEAWVNTWSGAFPAGIHRLRVEVVSGRVLLDGGERWREEGAMPPAAEKISRVEEQGCQCGGGGGASALGLLAVLQGLLRRRVARKEVWLRSELN